MLKAGITEIRKLRRVPKKKFKKRAVCWGVFLLLGLALLALSVGCAASSKDARDQAEPAAAEYTSVSGEAGMVEEAFSDHEGRGAGIVGDLEAGAEAGTGVEQEERRYVILHARLTLEIEEMEAVAGTIQEQVRELGGYLVSLEYYDFGDERRAGELAVRIPANKFDNFLESLDDWGEVKNPHVYSDDVTMQYIDLEARLKNLAAQEEKMRGLLDKAQTVEEILQVEKELGRIRGDLEAMTAEFKYLRESVRYSTVEIRLEEKDPRMTEVTGGFDSFWERIGCLLSLNTNRLFRGFSSLLILAIGSLPILVPLGLLAYLGWKAIQYMRARKKKSTNHKDNFSS
ncbi:MAG: DUF4349 domain-containing protein [Firmicutes bacterium]|nr:DUF4349 domain-containing protein [Bacillota bacterium]